MSNVADQRHLELLTGEVFRALDDLAKNSIGSISRMSAKPDPRDDLVKFAGVVLFNSNRHTANH
ncbi:hypothetical protein D3C84_1048630 [compost metagenome]